jgi:hypothetical protein
MTFRGGAVAALALLALGVACGDEGNRGASVGSPGGDRRYEGSFTVLESAEHGPELCHMVEDSLPPQCGGLPVVGWDWDTVEGEERVGDTTWGEWHVTGTFDGERFRLTEPPGPPLLGDHDRGLDFSPACDEPDVVDPSHGVAEWEAATQIDGVFDSRELVAAWVSDPGGDWDGPFVGNLVVVPGAAQAAVARVREHYAGALCVIERDAPTAVELAAVQRELTNEDARAILGTIQSAAADERRGVVVATIWLVDEAAMDYADQRWGDLVELRGLLRPV